MTEELFDVVIVGAGIAGASLASELAKSTRVLLLEMESQPGFHATGRSAAFFAPSYGSEAVRAITACSESFYRQPPSGFSELELLRPRDALFIGREDQNDSLQALAQEVAELLPLSGLDARETVPLLAPTYVHAGLLDSAGGDLDVDAILQGYLRSFRQCGGKLACESRVQQLTHANGLWSVQLEHLRCSAPVVVNAAGAWADQVAATAGLAPLQLQPMKRTAVLLAPAEGNDISRWPLVIDVDEMFYFKPDAGQILLSPADETPCEACDIHADELDIAIAVDRFQKATTMQVQRIDHKWAGLRTFAPDREFVVGFDPRASGFFWLAGQGGYGVQSAPGLARLAALLITGATPDAIGQALLRQRDTVDPGRLI